MKKIKFKTISSINNIVENKAKFNIKNRQASAFIQ